MKYLAILLFVSSIGYIVLNESRRESVDIPTKFDTLVSKSDSLAGLLTSSDSAVVNKIEKVSNTITGLKSEVKDLKEKVQKLTKENNELKKTLADVGSMLGNKFKFLPIGEDNR